MQNKEKGSIIRLLADCKEKITKLEKENAELRMVLNDALCQIKDMMLESELDMILESELRERNE